MLIQRCEDSLRKPNTLYAKLKTEFIIYRLITTDILKDLIYRLITTDILKDLKIQKTQGTMI